MSGFYGRTPRNSQTSVPRRNLMNSQSDVGSEGPSDSTIYGSTHRSENPGPLSEIRAMITKGFKEVIDPLNTLQQKVEKIESEINSLKQKIDEKELTAQSGATNKPIRLPKVLTAAVKKLHAKSENQFDGSKLYSDSYNQEVAEGLKVELEHEFGVDFSRPLYTRAVYRHFESRRRIHVDSQPTRQNAKLNNEKKTKLRNRQKQLYERRMKLCKEKEIKFWSELNEKFMTEEESDEDDISILLQHKPSWRSEKLSKFISILDKRDKNQKKKRRVLATESTVTIPQNAPAWAVNLAAPMGAAVSDRPNSELMPQVTTHSPAVEQAQTTSSQPRRKAISVASCESPPTESFDSGSISDPTMQSSPVLTNVLDHVLYNKQFPVSEIISSASRKFSAASPSSDISPAVAVSKRKTHLEMPSSRCLTEIDDISSSSEEFELDT